MKIIEDGNYFVQHTRNNAGYSLLEGNYYCHFIKDSTFFTANGKGPYEGRCFYFLEVKEDAISKS